MSICLFRIFKKVDFPAPILPSIDKIIDGLPLGGVLG
jgi:hypothetical protein